MTLTQIALAGWIFLGTVIGAFVRRGVVTREIRVVGDSSQRTNGFRGYVFTIEKCSSSAMVLGRVDHSDAIRADIVDGAVTIRWNESSLADVAQVTEDIHWTKKGVS